MLVKRILNCRHVLTLFQVFQPVFFIQKDDFPGELLTGVYKFLCLFKSH